MPALVLKETMSSREIAHIVGKPHSDLLKSIRSMENAWEKVNGGKFSLVEYKDTKGEMRPEYQLNKMECLYVATKFNNEARAKLILRWGELEEKAKEPQTRLLPAGKRNQQQIELIELIRSHLLRGDVVDVAKQNGFSRNTCENVMRHRCFHPNIVKALYDRAISNKISLGKEIGKMIEELKK